MPTGKLSRYFTWAEAACKCGCDIPPAVLRHIEGMAPCMDSIRDSLGPVHVTSWYRCTAHNASIGGATNSRHLVGDAVDFHVKDRDTGLWLPGERVRGYVDRMMERGCLPMGGLGTYRNSPWLVHVDRRGARARWVH